MKILSVAILSIAMCYSTLSGAFSEFENQSVFYISCSSCPNCSTCGTNEATVCQLPYGRELWSISLFQDYTGHCTQGYNWGLSYEGRRLWVKEGCKGMFRAVTVGPNQLVTRLVCESKGFAKTECPVTFQVLDARLKYGLSKASCNFGSSWGFTDTGLWVDQGCRGDFVVLGERFTPKK